MKKVEIVHTNDTSYIGKFCRKCNKIKLSSKYRNLIKPLRLFILEHEIAHSEGADSEIEADRVAFTKMIEKGYPQHTMEHLLISTKMRTQNQLSLL